MFTQYRSSPSSGKDTNILICQYYVDHIVCTLLFIVHRKMSYSVFKYTFYDVSGYYIIVFHSSSVQYVIQQS